MNREAAAAGEAHTAYQTPTHDQIALEAHQLWLRAGRPEGHAQDHWFAAERALRFPSSVDEEIHPAVPPPPPLPPPMGAGPAPTPAPPPRVSAPRRRRRARGDTAGPTS